MIDNILKTCIGHIPKKIFLEWFYMDNEPISIARLDVQLNSRISIGCSEERVWVKQLDNPPEKISFDNFDCIPIEQTYSYFLQNKIIDIKYLIDSYSFNRGVLFLFENGYNFVFYNTGYEDGNKDETFFEVNVEIDSLPYIISS